MGILCSLTNKFITTGDDCVLLPIVPRFRGIKVSGLEGTELTSTVTSGPTRFYKFAGLPIFGKYGDYHIENLEVNSLTRQYYMSAFGRSLEDAIPYMHKYQKDETELCKKVKNKISEVMYIDRKAYDYVVRYVQVHEGDFYVNLNDMGEELTSYLEELNSKDIPTGIGVHIDRTEELLKDFKVNNISYFHKNITFNVIEDYVDTLLDMYCFYLYLDVTGKFVVPSNSEDGASTHIQLNLANLALNRIYEVEMQRMME